MKKIVIGISGASGAVFGKKALEYISGMKDVESHLIISKAAEKTIALELGMSAEEVKTLADVAYDNENIGAAPASGSFYHDGMLICPCSVNTLSSIAHGFTPNLLTRAADVTLKERRKLVLMVRESPLHVGHIKSMLEVSQMGAVVSPPSPAMYLKPQTAEDICDQIILRNLELLGLDVSEHINRWKG